jgi:hypothetical protein
VAELLPPNHIAVRIEALGLHDRRIEVMGPGAG